MVALLPEYHGRDARTVPSAPTINAVLGDPRVWSSEELPPPRIPCPCSVCAAVYEDSRTARRLLRLPRRRR